MREPDAGSPRATSTSAARRATTFDLERWSTTRRPGYATAVYVSAEGVQRIRTTAESHRRIAIIEVMGRHCRLHRAGHRLRPARHHPHPRVPARTSSALVERVPRALRAAEARGHRLRRGHRRREGPGAGRRGSLHRPRRQHRRSPAPPRRCAQLLIERLGDAYFTSQRRNETANAAIFTRKVGHTQRGGRPILFDRFYAAQLGGKAVDLLLEGHHNAVAILQWNRERGFYVDSVDGNAFRDRWGIIHARHMHPSLLRPASGSSPRARGSSTCCRSSPTPSASTTSSTCARPCSTPATSSSPYHSVNVDINKRIRYLEAPQ